MPSKWVIRLAIIAGIAIIAATIFRLLTPPNPTIPQSEVVTTNTDGSTTTFANVQYTGPEITVPGNFDISASQALPVTAVEKLSQDYQMESSSTTFKVWRGPQYTMTYSSQIEQYSMSLNQPTVSTAPLDPDTNRQVAENFVQKYFPNEGLQILETQILYSADESEQAVEPAQAQAGTYPFSYTVSGFPVVLGNNNLLPVTVSVNNSNQLSNAVFTAVHLQLTPQGRKPALSVAKAIENINKGQASVSQAFQENFQTINLASITGATLTSGTIQYRLDPATQFVYPFYVFRGTATNAENVNLIVEISTPAVAIN